jgi:hypothetical protein
VIFSHRVLGYRVFSGLFLATLYGRFNILGHRVFSGSSSATLYSRFNRLNGFLGNF